MSTSAPTPPPRTAGGSNSNRFFSWIRSLGIVRADGWISGVCGGIAIRTGIDPLIVRGIAIVIAVLGGPAFLFYAAAWLLLPDTSDEIHLEKLLRGFFEPVVIAIGVVLLLTFLPIAQGFWWAGGSLAHGFWWAPIGLLKLLWNLAIVGLIVWFVIWMVARLRGRRGAAPTMTAAPAAAQTPVPESTPSGSGQEREEAETAAEASAAAPTATIAPSEVTLPALSEPSAPTAPGKDASADELARWREQHEAWRAQHDAWRAQLRADQRLERDRRTAVIRAQSQAMAAQAEAARAGRRAANPRTSGWYIALALGAALVAGGIAGAIASGGGLAAYAAPIGFAAALTTVGFAMFVAGFMRRRAGFLSAIAISLAVLTACSFGLPSVRGTSGIGYAVVNAGVDTSYGQFAGRIEVRTSAEHPIEPQNSTLEIKQGAGSVSVYIAPGVHATINVTSHDSHVYADANDATTTTRKLDRQLGSKADGDPETARYQTPGDGDVSVIIDIQQGNGEVDILDSSHPFAASGSND